MKNEVFNEGSERTIALVFVLVVESPGWLQREVDEKTGLPVLNPAA
jgi:hypothetical protein